MTEERFISAIKIVIINLAVLAALLGTVEIVARLAYPEFQGHIHSPSKTLGINRYYGNFLGIKSRVPRPGYQHATDKPLFVVLGDSISDGYGMAYEDIYWVRLQRLAEIRGIKGLEFVAPAYYGNNLADSANAIRTIATQAQIPIKFILYQFQPNDVTPYGSEALHNIGEGIVKHRFFRTLAVWRYEYLNHSVFLRVVQHYGGMAVRRLSGTCEERGLDALGPYTWSYGSVRYKTDAEVYWREFESQLKEVKSVADKVGARLYIFVSPLVFDIDRAGKHPHFNHTRFDFSCATIDPRARVAQLALRLGIPAFDPAEFLRTNFEARLAENNFTPFFFTADEAHFNQTTASYVAEYLEPRIFGVTAAPVSLAPQHGGK